MYKSINSALLILIALYGFMLRDADRYVAVFTSEGSHLFTTNIYTPGLPKADREALKDGISVDDEVQLWSILEDFGS